jgi:hypothetical protein
MDELQKSVEQRVKDSLRVKINYHSREIYKIKQELKTQRRYNAELQKKYNSLSVSLPEL